MAERRVWPAVVLGVLGVLALLASLLQRQNARGAQCSDSVQGLCAPAEVGWAVFLVLGIVLLAAALLAWALGGRRRSGAR